MRPSPIPDALRKRPFTRAEARAHGLTDGALGGSRFRRVFRGVYVCADVPLDFATTLQAARLLIGNAPATHLTGLRSYGVEVGPVLPLRFAGESIRDPEHRDIHVIRRMRVAEHDGEALRPEQCWVDACLDLDLVDAVIAADWLIHVEATTLERLTLFVDATDNWEGIRKARLALPYVRENVRSPRETLTRLMIVLAGLPEPDECNLDVYEDDRFLGCADLVWLAFMLVVEYDGRQHADDPNQWNHDLDRVQHFVDAAWRFYRVTNRRLRAPREVVRRVYKELVKGGYTGPEPVFSEEWSRLFERRPAYRR